MQNPNFIFIAIIIYRTYKRCLFAVYKLMISQILFGFKSFAAIFADKSRRCRVSFEVTAQKSLDEKAFATVQACIVVRGGFLMVLQRLQIRE